MRPDVGPDVGCLRIAVITRNFATHGGGAERYAVALAEQLAVRHEVHVFAQAIEHNDPRMSYHALPAQRKPRWLNQWLFARRVARLTTHGFDIVHSHENGHAGQVQTVHVRPMRHSLLPPMDATSSDASASYRRKPVSSADGTETNRLCRWWFDWIPACAGMTKLQTLCDRSTIRRLAQRGIQWLKVLTSLRLMVYLRLEAARFTPCPGRVIGVVSATLRDEMASSYPQTAACLHVLPPGVALPAQLPEKQTARLQLGLQLNLPSEAFLLLFVANDYRRKGLDTVLAALAVGADAPHLLVVGDSAQAAEYQARAQALGIAERVHFLGCKDDMSPLYAAADLLLHPTREDTFGMVVLEAMAHGLPVIVSRAPFCGLSADLSAQEAVLLHDPQSSDELAAALQGLMHDAARRSAMAVAGRTLAARYHWAQLAERYEQLYRILLAEAS